MLSPTPDHEESPLSVFAAPRRSAWQRWRSLYDDILRHVRACDRLGVELTLDQLAEDLDEALGLVERRVKELRGLQLLRCNAEGRVELGVGSQRMCG